jgi:hypothetical protein
VDFLNNPQATKIAVMKSIMFIPIIDGSPVEILKKLQAIE